MNPCLNYNTNPNDGPLPRELEAYSIPTGMHILSKICNLISNSIFLVIPGSRFESRFTTKVRIRNANFKYLRYFVKRQKTNAFVVINSTSEEYCHASCVPFEHALFMGMLQF